MPKSLLKSFILLEIDQIINDPEWKTKLIADLNPASTAIQRNKRRSAPPRYKGVAQYDLEGNLVDFHPGSIEQLRATLGYSADYDDEKSRPSKGFFWRKIKPDQEVPKSIDVSKIRRYNQIGLSHFYTIEEFDPRTKQIIGFWTKNKLMKDLKMTFPTILSRIKVGLPINGRYFKFGLPI